MCIAILNKSNILPDSCIENSFDNNNQGAGLLYVKNGKLTTFKTYEKKQILKEYKKVRKLINTPIVLHFRIATSGFSKENLHPFLVNKDLGFVHNGVIYGLGNEDFSDTYQFNEILKTMPKDFLDNNGIKTLISKFIESDKIIFLDSQNNFTIINEQNGHYDKMGNWYSNSSYQQKNNYVWAGNKKVFNYLDDILETDNQTMVDFMISEYQARDENDLKECLRLEGFNTVKEAYEYYAYGTLEY